MAEQIPPSPWTMVLDAIARVESRLDKLVTTETHQADMRRVDHVMTGLAADMGVERAARAEDRAQIWAAVEALRKSQEDERSAREMGLTTEANMRGKEIDEAKSEWRTGVRWGIGVVLTGVGVAAAVVSVVVSNLT
jgi:hypothetical protein